VAYFLSIVIVGQLVPESPLGSKMHKHMKNLLRAEEGAQLALAILAIYLQPITIAWWLWPILFLSPDISMLAYLHNAHTGAWTYNLFHHKGIAAIIILVGFLAHAPWVLLIGLILFAHSAFDRIAGYGLKHQDSFSHTHLGFVGKAKVSV
jgi:hypothetical protein